MSTTAKTAAPGPVPTATPKPWLASYPADVPTEIDTTGVTSISDLLAEACRLHAARPAFSCMGKT